MDDCDFINKGGVFIHKNSYEKYEKSVEYSDSSEDYLLEIFRKAKDLSSYSLELRKHIKDWPSEYHLSISRANILRCFDFHDKDMSVLELGCGVGTITRYLGENFKTVDAIEGNLKRAYVAEERCKDLDNVKIYCANFFDLPFQNEYDIVTLIGVLEYSRKFYPQLNPKSQELAELELLKKAYNALNSHGILILAIENKLGLKYWTGCTEDHTGNLLYEGLYGYPSNTGIFTWSKKELEELILKAGFKPLDFFYPFPDYKLPKIIIKHEDYLSKGLKVYNWIDTPFPERGNIREKFMLESLILRELYKANLIDEFANSFLVIAYKGDNVFEQEQNWRFKSFSTNRSPKFATVTTLHNDLRITKKKLFEIENTRTKEGNFKLNVSSKKEGYVDGDLWIYKIYESIGRKTFFKDTAREIKELNNFLIKRGYTEIHDNDGYPMIDGRLVDATFWNIIIDEEGNKLLIDQEYQYKESIGIDYILYRNLLWFFGDCGLLYQNVGLHDINHEIISTIKQVYPQYSIKRHKRNHQLESELQSLVADSTVNIEKRVKYKNFVFKYRKLLTKLITIMNRAGLEKYYIKLRSKVK